MRRAAPEMESTQQRAVPLGSAQEATEMESSDAGRECTGGCGESSDYIRIRSTAGTFEKGA